MNVLRSLFYRSTLTKSPQLGSVTKAQGLLAVIISVVLVSCAQTPEQPSKPTAERTPIPKSVTLQVPSNDISAPKRTIQKSLFQVLLTPLGLSANGVEVPSLEALQKLLAQYNRPMITLTVHRCVDAQRAKSFLNSIQSLTDTAIAYSAFGAYTDSECGDP